MFGRPRVWAVLKTGVGTASLALAFFVAPLSVDAANLNSISSVEHGGRSIVEGESLYRSDFSSISNSWRFNFSWPNSVPNANAVLAVIRGTYGNVPGGLQSGVTYGSTVQAWGAGQNALVKSISLPPLGGLAAQTGTYTVLVAHAASTQSALEWFASGGSAGTEPTNYSLLTFTYTAESVAVELPSAVSYVQYGSRQILPGQDVLQEEVTPNTNNPTQFWRFNFTWPNAVSNANALFMVFRGTYGALGGGAPVSGTNYAATLQAWAAGQNTIGKFISLPGLESEGAEGTYTVMVAERDPKFNTNGTAQEALWFSSGGTQGVAPRKYSLFTFTLTSPPRCCSSVLFLPGIMGSELHDSGNKLWEPDNEQDVVALYLDSAGNSVSPTVDATTVIRTFDALANVDIYDEFVSDLGAAGTSRKINSYAAVPYDWRLSIPDILADRSIEEKLRALAATSHTDKVTIVAHSNGGLVAKALINALGAEASDLVDQVVLVAVPQSGTPQAVAGLLHGADASIPWSFTEARARVFAKNAPFAYHLLPHLDYYESAGATINTPIVTFAPNVSTQFTTPYGTTIDTTPELRSFINGAEGRSEPGYNELEYPSTGNAALLSSADLYMSSIGPDWQPPAGIMVHQIAGVGEDTLAGITYKPSVRCAERYVSQTSTPTCTRYENTVILSPDEVIDGDGTVVEPSALAMSSSDSIKRWWVDLDGLNELLGFIPIPNLPSLRIQHANFLEDDEVRTLVFETILSETENAFDFISVNRPQVSRGDRLKFTLHSPLGLSVLAPEGVVSENKITIPGTSYKRYGEVQVIWVPKNLAPTLKLEGVEEGSFILEVEEYAGENKVNEVQFAGIPSTVGTIVTMEFHDGTITNAEDLQLDYNGDGTTDVALAPVPGDTVTLPKLGLTVTAQNKSMLFGEPIPPLTYGISGLPEGVSLEDTDITGTPECTTNATPTSPVGTYPITCTAGTLQSDYYSFETFVAGTLTITYTWSGFQQPIDDPVATPGISPSVFKAGSTVPVKFKLKNANGAIVEAIVLPQWLTPTRGAPLSGSVDEPVYSDPATTGNMYRYDSTSQQYIYNWKTNKSDAGYWYKIYAKLDDGTIKSVMIGLR